MILIYCKQSTTRLQYICKFIFEEQMDLRYSLTIDAKNFASHDGPKINYSQHNFDDHSFTITACGLLEEKKIVPQQINCFAWKGLTAFFKTETGSIEFDILAASFYLLSRYEEYLPFEKDEYGRYDYRQSLACKENFLQTPLINFWLIHFREALQTHFPEIKITTPKFNFQPTYDIDMAWAYKNKGILRNLGGLLETRSLNRLPVLMRLQKDPFDSFDFLKDLHAKNNVTPIYFILLAQRRSEYDKNISPYDFSMWQLMKRLNKEARVGIHPSWRSNEHTSLIKKERKILETATASEVQRSRQHYIYFNLPDTFEHLLLANIKDDYSMGYGSINGFRASVASSFNWYNLETEKATVLRMHPFCFMDANSHYEQKQTLAETEKELNYYFKVCKEANGNLITIFHNNFLGTGAEFKGWAEMYSNFIAQVQK